MAHGIEIRVPFVDTSLLGAIAPLIPTLKAGAGKAALAGAPSMPLPEVITSRAKTGFAVPTAAWMNSASGAEPSATARTITTKGLVSRDWSRLVFGDASRIERAARAA
jgi:asparagine synthase (glutamine-hydrolysing)